MQQVTNPVRIAARSEQQQVLIAALRQLADEQRQVIALRVLGDLRFREIAQKCNDSIHN